MTLKSKENITGLTITLPMVAYLCIFLIVPLGLLFYYSFTDYGIADVPKWVSFENFKSFFIYPEYFASLVSTLIIAVFVTVFTIVIGFLLALFMNSLKFGTSLVRVVWYIPGLLSMAIVSQFLKIYLSPEGALNTVFMALSADPIMWYDSTFWMYFWIIFMMVWKGVGGIAIYFIAGLNSIDASVYEAADIDGAGPVARLFKITLPLLKPILAFVLITSFMGAMNIFEPVLLISHGGPDGSTKVILYRIYDEAFKNFKYGFACALSLLIALVTFVLTLINIKISDSSLYKADER